MEQKLSDTLVKAIDRSNPMMQNLQLASRFNKLVEEGSGGITTLYCWKSSDDKRVYSTTLTPKSVLRAENFSGGDYYGKINSGLGVSGQEGDTLDIYRVGAFTRFPDDDIELN